MEGADIMMELQKKYTQQTGLRNSCQEVIDGFKKELKFKDQIIQEKTILIKQLKLLIRSMEKGE